jgi:Flp pilus assembly pilin Flp
VLPGERVLVLAPFVGLGGPMFTYLSYLLARLRFAVQRQSSEMSRGRFQRRSLEAGQASVEYALVLLGAALVATLLITWATSTDLIGGLFDYILNLIKGKAK